MNDFYRFIGVIVAVFLILGLMLMTCQNPAFGADDSYCKACAPFNGCWIPAPNQFDRCNQLVCEYYCQDGKWIETGNCYTTAVYCPPIQTGVDPIPGNNYYGRK